MNKLLLNSDGNLRSGWRALVFLFLFILLAVIFGTISQIILSSFQINVPPKSPAYFAINGLTMLIPAILAGWLCGRWLEKLPISALGTEIGKTSLVNFIVGLTIGASTLSLAVAIAYLFGGLRFQFTDASEADILASLAFSLFVFGIMAAFEEALFRGYILQTLGRSGYAWPAILLTALGFGAVHADNPDANSISIVNTVLAGIWFGVAYLKTRDLWLVWGLHLMWNWMQGTFFGIEVSGLIDITSAPLLKEIDSGPAWLTGEGYGIEGGIACTFVLLLSTAIIHFLPLPWASPKG